MNKPDCRVTFDLRTPELLTWVAAKSSSMQVTKSKFLRSIIESVHSQTKQETTQ
jgi:hypothetical protein